MQSIYFAIFELFRSLLGTGMTSLEENISVCPAGESFALLVDGDYDQEFERLKEFKWKLDASVGYIYCDLVLNVFMMRRKVWDSQGWDPKIKTWPEHEDFFFSVKKNVV